MATDWIRLHLSGWKYFGGYLLWGVGRIGFSLWLFGLTGLKSTFKIAIAICEMTENATHQLLGVYTQLPYLGTLPDRATITTNAVTIPSEPENIITNLTRALEGKHCLIVGDTGTGKSTLAQWLAYQVGGEVTVYDPDCSPEEWQGLNVIGRKGDFDSIQEAMTSDLEELQRRIELRGEHGDKALAGLDSVLIAEEFPLLKDEVPVAVDWLIKHARRGRKPKRFIIALSQDDNVASLGIEGQGAVRKNFRVLRLGKFAHQHAKALKDTALVDWLKSANYRCMVDDQPCQLPDIKGYMMFTPRLLPNPVSHSVVIPGPTTQQGLQPPEIQVQGLEEPLNKAVKALLDSGFSESKVIKEILGYRGGQYQQGKEVLEEIKNN
jgi:energy-coupling factor transporter ATP-binding protein EcfA2